METCSPQAAPDVRIGGGQRRRAPKIWSKLAKSGGMPPVKFFFDNAKCCKLGHFLNFCLAFGGGMAPPGPPPLEPPMNLKVAVLDANQCVLGTVPVSGWFTGFCVLDAWAQFGVQGEGRTESMGIALGPPL